MARRKQSNMAGMIDDLRAQWDQVINDGEIALANLAQAEQDMLATREIALRDPVDNAEWEAQYEKIVNVNATVYALRSAIDTVRGWLNSATSWIPGMSGLAGLSLQHVAKRGGNLKAIPVVAGLTVAGMIALVTRIGLIASAASAFVTYLLTKDSKQEQQQQQTQFYVDQGLDPEKAAEQARKDVTAQTQQETGYQFTTTLNKLFLYGGLGALAVFLLPEMMRGYRSVKK